MSEDDEIFAELDREIVVVNNTHGGIWAAFIVRALWRHPEGAFKADVLRDIRADAMKSGKAVPPSFSDTIQRSFQNFNGQADGFKQSWSEDIFCFPRGKGKGFWGLNRPKAQLWMSARSLHLR